MRAAPDALVMVHLDMLTAVFDRRSAQTHLLAAPLPEILSVMEAAPLRLSAVISALAAQYDLTAENDDLEPVIEARLNELLALRLVERV
jgi:PqqD family protein of HPr-rel-A system